MQYGSFFRIRGFIRSSWCAVRYRNDMAAAVRMILTAAETERGNGEGQGQEHEIQTLH